MVYGFMFTSHEPFQLQPQERNRLEQILRTTSLSAGLVRRARVLLLLAEGVSLRQIQAQTGMSPRRIQHWKRSWRKKGLDGLLDAPRPGRPKKLTVAKEAAILAATEEHPPGPVTHWSTRRLARRLGLSHVTVMRVWHKAGLQPHRLRRYMASPDPDFEAKAKDILGLYLNPPRHAAVFCVDEKTAIQALDRTQPVLPLSPGRAQRHGFEYYRHGTLSLYAALDTQSGEVIGRTAERHTSDQFVAFLSDIVAHQPKGREIHVILDNLSAHKTKRVDAFLAEHPQVRLHFTPTYASWLNQVELWFAKIERDVIARGIFTSVKDLARKLMRYIRHYNQAPMPVKWKYSDPRRRITT